jgi:hypothetical protein
MSNAANGGDTSTEKRGSESWLVRVANSAWPRAAGIAAVAAVLLPHFRF